MCVSEREITELRNHSEKSREILGEKLVFDENAPGKELLLAGTEKEMDENAPGKELLLPGTEKEMDENAHEEKEEMMKSKAERVASYLGEKSKGVIAGIENTSGYLVEKLDGVFPPESRERVAHLIEVGAPYISAGVAVASYLGFPGRLAGVAVASYLGFTGGLFGSGGGEEVEKMMKAPGLTPGKELLLAGTGKEVDENAPGKELLLAGTEEEMDENAPWKELLLPGTEKEMDENAPEEKEEEETMMMKSKAERVASYLGEKTKGVIAGIESTSGYLVEKLDGVFPPESRERVAHWIEVGAPYISAGVAVASCLGFTGRLFGSGGGGEKVEKMMKAPGLKGVKIPRKPFEDNPRAYFRATRGKF